MLLRPNHHSHHICRRRLRRRYHLKHHHLHLAGAARLPAVDGAEQHVVEAIALVHPEGAGHLVAWVVLAPARAGHLACNMYRYFSYLRFNLDVNYVLVFFLYTCALILLLFNDVVLLFAVRFDFTSETIEPEKLLLASALLNVINIFVNYCKAP